jgi:hypothetical protein
MTIYLSQHPLITTFLANASFPLCSHLDIYICTRKGRALTGATFLAPAEGWWPSATLAKTTTSASLFSASLFSASLSYKSDPLPYKNDPLPYKSYPLPCTVPGIHTKVAKVYGGKNCDGGRTKQDTRKTLF